MSPYESALISEAYERDWRSRVRTIAGHNYEGQSSACALWWQVSDLHLLSFDIERERDYGRHPELQTGFVR